MLHSSGAHLFANISTLNLDNLTARGENSSIDWSLHREWHDECVKVAKRWDHDNGNDWSNYYRESSDEAELTSSYMGGDHSVWDPRCQQERDATLTLSPLGVEGHLSASLLEDLDTIILHE